ncbi:hypothetical protein [Alkalimonas amylolytica]|uniref:DUF2897 domain-containing protein n=1 Tax=Alkalimonas amylolytica TaxID=152573 RepID=A0A1H4AZS3_ALKAM|nr:hypothetical protein [Alkalimonas amylolytica]SEA41287.1 hypothetical protein SAMN04488051_10399 [Alkalimonas amylolytica]
MNWMLLTALALAFGLILGNLMLIRYLDKLPGSKVTPKTKPDTGNEPAKDIQHAAAKQEEQAKPPSKPPEA